MKYIFTDEVLTRIVEIARYAPSVHNAQHWKVRKTELGLLVLVDRENILGPGDPTGRQTAISMGIFCEALCLAAESMGFKPKHMRYSHDVINIDFIKKEKPKLDIDYPKLLKSRVTDRSIFKKVELSIKDEERIRHSWNSKNLKIWVVDQDKFIKHMSELTFKGVNLALSNPEFRNELSKLLIYPWSNKKRGISLESLRIPFLPSIVQPTALRLGFNMKQEAKLEKKRWESSSAIILISTEGDLHNDWFEAGRAYLKVSLIIEDIGLSQATSAATVEASTYHEDVEEMLETNQRLQAVIRIGKGSDKKIHSPRISTEELITLS